MMNLPIELAGWSGLEIAWQAALPGEKPPELIRLVKSFQ